MKYLIGPNEFASWPVKFRKLASNKIRPERWGGRQKRFQLHLGLSRGRKIRKHYRFTTSVSFVHDCRWNYILDVGQMNYFAGRTLNTPGISQRWNGKKKLSFKKSLVYNRGGHLRCNYFASDSACAAIIFKQCADASAASILVILRAIAIQVMIYF